MSEDDDRTRLIGRRPSQGQETGDDQPTRLIRPSEDLSDDPPTSEPTRVFSDDEETVLMDHEPAPESPASSGGDPVKVQDDEKTVLFRPPAGARSGDSGAAPGSTATPAETMTDEPVVGWLVVVAGPGRGKFHKLGYGINPVGRDPSLRVCLDHGDRTVSRDSHVAIAYDQKGRSFFIQQGTGTALAYLDGTPVLQPSRLEGGERISVGDTELVFVPFCGADFDWQDA